MPRERRAILSSLQSKGFTLEPGNNHDILRLSREGFVGSVFTIVSRGTAHRDYGDNLLARMCRQLHLTRAQLNDLIDCPLDNPAYTALLTERGIIRPLPQKDA